MIPFGIYAVIVLLILYIIFFRIEKINHGKNIKSIPIRIWVNGSRGKSSVTRLIAAGLRASGKKVIAKTTGTKPRFIVKNDLEIPVLRMGVANIKEQISIFKKATREKPDAIVLECMALRPDLQWTESIKIVKPTALAITNVRADHLDVMGPTVKDIAKTFINVAPRNCRIFTTKSTVFDDLHRERIKNNIKMTYSDEAEISDNIMKKFSYIEHKENVALALDVCEYYGADKKTALMGMYDTNPDPGALQKYSIDFDGKEITLIYAMAANDPDSTYLIWQSINKNFPEVNILINCRGDRIDRSFQLADLIIKRIQADKYIITGSATEVIRRKITKVIDKNKILDLGGKEPSHVYRSIAKFVTDKSIIFAVGNTVGYGEQMIEEFLKYKR
jgi:poly-gamma-glutamate synthase PgsB/CapB